MNSSAIFQTFLLIIFSMSGHTFDKYGYDYEETDPLPVEYYRDAENLCHFYYRNNFEIKSIFNLDQEIYVISKDERGVYQMWRLPIDYPNEYNGHKLGVDRQYRSPSFLRLMNELFDLEKPISGFVIDRNDWPHIISKCHEIGPIVPEDEKDCEWAYSFGRFRVPDLICIYGSDKVTGKVNAKPIFHNSVENNVSIANDMVVPFKDDKKDAFNRICSVKSPETVQNPNDLFIYSTESIVKWIAEFGPNMDVFIEEAVPRNKTEKSIPKTLLTVQMYDRKGTNISQVFNVINERKDIAIGFYYNDFVKFLFCGQPCYLDSPLKWTTDFEPPPFWFNETDSGINGLIPTPIRFKSITKNRLTLRTLVNCESLDYRLFQPNDICSGKMSFLSIFNLGKDVYFQKSGRFWKYSGDGFTSGSNSFAGDLDVKISPVRYDSDFTAFLESEGFDTSSKIVGVNFKTKYQDFCGLSDGNCQYKYRSSEYHFKVCLYGVKGNEYSKTGTHVKFGEVFYGVYSYTPSRLKRINKQQSESFCHKFMTSVLGEWGGDPFEYFSVTNPTNDTVSRYGGVGYNVVYSFNKLDAREGQVFVRHRWRKDKPDFNYNGVTQDQISHNKRSRSFTYIFSMNGQVWGYSDQRNGDLYRLIEDYQSNQTYMEEKIGGNLYNLLNCPFISSTSLVTLNRRQKVCNKYVKRQKESILYIGSTNYHQIGRYFYKWTDSHLFYYDKQVSNLLNDHFDTTKRVMGYSFSLSKLLPEMFPYEDQQNDYAVVIYGTSHPRYRRLGKKVYGLFRLNEEYMPTLIAVNDLTNFPMSNKITFGNLIPDTKTPKILCYFAANGPNKDMKNETTFFTYIEDFNDLLIFRFTNHSSQLNYPFDTSVYEQQKWFMFSIKKELVAFNEIVGYSHFRGWVTVMTLKSTPDEDNPNEIYRYFVTDIYWLSAGYPHIENIAMFFLPNFNISAVVHSFRDNSWTLNDHYKYFDQYCQRKLSSGVESELTNKTLTTILVFTLLVLLITALIVGITGYFRNEKNAKKVTEISESNAVKPTQSVSGDKTGENLFRSASV